MSLTILSSLLLAGAAELELPEDDAGDDDGDGDDRDQRPVDPVGQERILVLAEDVEGTADGQREATLDRVTEAGAEADHQDPDPEAGDLADRALLLDGEVEVDERGEEAEEQEDLGEDGEQVAFAAPGAGLGVEPDERAALLVDGGVSINRT